jgi:hypothetical protein
MRVDKDALIKHHWWILLGVFFLLWLVSVGLIKTASAAGKAKADYDSAAKSLEATKAKNPKNPSFNAPWEAYGQTYAKQKDRIWGDAWDVQKDIFDWPSSSTAHFDRLKYPDDRIEYSERIEYQTDLWKTQFKNLEAELAPIEFAGGTEGFVRIMMPGFAKGTVRQSAQPTAPGTGPGPGLLSRDRSRPGNPGAPAQANPAGPDPFENFWAHVPSEEECWLAQEDFWVKRELLRIVREAVHNVARFTEDKEALKKEKPIEGVVSRHLFRNNLWEVDFMAERPKGQWFISSKSTLKNLHPAKRIVPLSASPNSGGLHFLVRQGSKVFYFRVDGEPLPYGGVVSFAKSWEVDSINFDKPFELEEDFENANSPVREIVELQLGKQSSRTANAPLLTSLTILPKPDDSKGPATPPPPASTGAPPPQPAAGGAPPGQEESTTNGLPRQRYIFRSKQCRHIPIGLLLIVDQAHMHEVLVAMSNSRLRVQTTQVQYRHLDHYQSPTSGAVPGGGQLINRGFAPGGAPAGAAVSPLEEDQNLMEMAIYGIANLYERFPPKDYVPPPPDTPAAPGTPTAPGAQQGTPGTPGAPQAAKSGTPGTPGAPQAAKPGTPAPPTTAAGKPAPGGGTPPGPGGKPVVTAPAAGTNPAAPNPAAAGALPAKNADAGKTAPAGKADAPPKGPEPGKSPAPAKTDPGKAPAPANPAEKGKVP